MNVYIYSGVLEINYFGNSFIIQYTNKHNNNNARNTLFVHLTGQYHMWENFEVHEFWPIRQFFYLLIISVLEVFHKYQEN